MRHIELPGHVVDRLKIVSDERINYWADRFVRLGIRELAGVPFSGYVEHPGYYEIMADTLRCGYGLQRDERDPGLVRVVEV